MEMTERRVSPQTAVRGRDAWSTGAIAGLAGGVAEIAWIALYQGVTDHQGAAVAHGVTKSVVPQLAASSAAVPLGVAIHMALALALGIAIALMLRAFLPRIVGTALEPVVVVGLLVVVWAMNFFVVLPVINPGFITLVPYGATLISKILFGFAAAFVFWFAGRPLQPSSTNETEEYDVK